MENMKKHIIHINKIKRYVTTFIMISYLFSLVGCAYETSVNSMEKENYFNDYTIPLENEFYNLIKNNPIDKKFLWSDSGSENRIMFAAKYCETWEAEIDHTIEILKNDLSSSDYQSLVSSYDGWKQYTQNIKLIEQNIFYIGGNYISEENMPTGDGNTYPRVMEIAAARTKNYAVELMALEYSLTGKVEFVYRSIEDTPKEQIEPIKFEIIAKEHEILSENICKTVYPVSDDKWLSEQLSEDINNEATIEYFLFDFNNDGRDEYIVSYRGSNWETIFGNSVWIYEKTVDNTLNEIFHETVTLYDSTGTAQSVGYNHFWPISVLNEKTNGFYDIVLPWCEDDNQIWKYSEYGWYNTE